MPVAALDIPRCGAAALRGAVAAVLLLSDAVVADPFESSPMPADAADAPMSSDDPELHLRSVVAAALARDPGQALIVAREAEARVLGARADSVLAGDVAFGLRWQDSGPLGRRGIREVEGGLELPLWRPGQRDAAARLAAGSRAQRDAEGPSRALRVAGDVRESVWALALARVRLDQARVALHAAEALEAVVLRRIEVGDLAAADALPARDWRLDREAQVQEADIVRVHAELDYRLLTGLEALPGRYTEMPIDVHEAASHPRLAALEAERDRAQAELALARRSRGGNPRVTVGARNELGGDDNSEVGSIGLGLSIPLGLSAAARAPEAAAAIAAAEAEAALALARRRYQYQRHEAEHERTATAEAHERLRLRAGLAERELANAAKAFAVGEIGLAERLRIEVRARGVLGDAARAEVEQGRAVARLNQILGVMP